MFDYILVCEAGLLWRRLFRRLEARVNFLMTQGFTIENVEHWGLLRRSYIVRLRRPRKEPQ